MLKSFRWLALEAKYLDEARTFYEDSLGLAVIRERETEVVYAAGDNQLVLRRPTDVPRGGIHTHYAFSTPADRYEAWWDRLSDSFDLQEHSFGSVDSLYLYDPDGNCVEIGGIDDTGEEITGIFEVVLEVEDLARAESFYEHLGFTAVDRGSSRRRVRLSGPMDLELWEPQLGIADARGGLHVDMGFEAEPDEVLIAIGEHACAVVDLDEGVRIKDPDGHWLTFY